MNAKLNSLKNVVAANKVGIAVTVTAVTCMTVARLALKQHNDFLKEKGLTEEFYSLEK